MDVASNEELAEQAGAPTADTSGGSQPMGGLISTGEPREGGWWSVTDAMTISASILVFGLVTILLTAWLLRRERESAVILRALATILIITFAVFLIVAGYSDQQIAPAMGLLGTIAGYLLGRDARGVQNEEHPRRD